MAAEISREDQAALDLHKIMLEAMRAREGEILRFLAFLLPAIAGFLASTWPRSPDGSLQTKIIFPTMSFITIILLFFGGWYTLALSYNYRYLQFVLYRLQKHLTLDRFQPEKWSQPFRFKTPPCKPFSCYKWLDYLLFSFAPEMFRTQLLLFFLLILALACTIRRWELGLSPCVRNLVVLSAVVALVLLVCLGFLFYPRKYRELDKELQ